MNSLFNVYLAIFKHEHKLPRMDNQRLGRERLQRGKSVYSPTRKRAEHLRKQNSEESSSNISITGAPDDTVDNSIGKYSKEFCPFIMLFSGSIGIASVVWEPCNKGTILQRDP